MTENTAIDRLNTHSAEVCTLYPHHRTHGLVLPFGWTNDVPTKPIYYMTPSRPLQETPLWAMSWVDPISPLDIRHLRDRPPSLQNKNVPSGDTRVQHNLGTQGYCRLPSQAA